MTCEQTRRVGTHSVWVMAQVPPCEAVTMSKAIVFQRTVFSLGTFQCSPKTGWGSVGASACAVTSSKGVEGTDGSQVVTQGEAGMPPGSFGSLGWLGPTAVSGPQVQGVPTCPGATGQRDPLETGSGLTHRLNHSQPPTVPLGQPSCLCRGSTAGVPQCWAAWRLRVWRGCPHETSCLPGTRFV